MIKIDVSDGFEVGSFHYSVESSELASKELQAKNCYGDCSIILKRMRVDLTLSEQEIHNTICHEFVEAVNDAYCYSKLKHDDIKGLTNGIAQILKSLGVIFISRRKKGG